MDKGGYSGHHENQADYVHTAAVHNLADGQETEHIDGSTEAKGQQEGCGVPVGGYVLKEYGHLQLAA